MTKRNKTSRYSSYKTENIEKVAYFFEKFYIFCNVYKSCIMQWRWDKEKLF